MHYLPLLVPLFALLVGAFLVVVVLIQIGILRYAYLRIGVSSRAAMALLLGSLIGSYINIPILELPKRVVPSGVETSHDYRHHRIRHNRHRLRTDTMASTVIAVNVGGAVIPALLSLYLLFKNRSGGPGWPQPLSLPRSFICSPILCPAWALQCRCSFPQSRPRWSLC